MMATDNSSLKSEILNNFKKELNDTLTNNNNTLSLKTSNDLDHKSMQFQSYLTTSVKELVTEMILLRTSTTPPSNITHTILPPSTSPPIQVYPSSQHPGGYPWPKDIISLNFLLHNS